MTGVMVSGCVLCFHFLCLPVCMGAGREDAAGAGQGEGEAAERQTCKGGEREEKKDEALVTLERC